MFSECKKTGELSTLLVAESAFFRAVNAGQPRTGIFASLLAKFAQLEYAKGMVLTLKPWRDAPPELLADGSVGVMPYWPLIKGNAGLDQAHSGMLSRWSLFVPNAAGSQECVSFCFSSGGKGAVALTGLDPIRTKAMLELKNVFSDAIEALLKRDTILACRLPGQPLLDMAECTWATLEEANEVLTRIATRPAVGQMVARAELLAKIRELCHYTHIDSGLAELSSSLLVLMHRVHEGPLSSVQIGALRHVFGCMRAITLPHEAVDECLDRLEEAGLDVYDAFGEDDDDQGQP